MVKNRKYFKIQKVKGRTFISGDRLMDPWGLNIVKDVLVVINDKAEPLVEIYDLKTRQLINSFLGIGKGPLEIVHATTIQPVGNKFYILGLRERKLLECDVEEVKKGHPYLPKLFFSMKGMPDKYQVVQKLLVGREGLIIAESAYPEGRVLLIDSKTKKGNYSIAYPDKSLVDSRLTDLANADIYSSAVALKPDGSKLAFCAYSADMIDLFEIRGMDCIPLWSYCGSYPDHLYLLPADDKVQVFFTDESTNCYITNTASDRYVYGLYSGKKQKEKDYAISDRVRVISWDGKETFEYRLDRPVKRIAVSPDDKTLYGIGTNEEAEYEIYAFDLP